MTDEKLEGINEARTEHGKTGSTFNFTGLPITTMAMLGGGEFFQPPDFEPIGFGISRGYDEFSRDERALIENYREERALQYPMANIIESKQEVPPTSNKVISEKGNDVIKDLIEAMGPVI